MLGKGHDSTVYLIIDKPNNKLFALKCANFNDQIHQYNFNVWLDLTLDGNQFILTYTIITKTS